MNIALTIIYILVALFLTVVVLSQQGKDPREASAVMGASSSFFSKNKGATIDSMLEKATAVAAVLFVILSVVMFVFVK
ncbi:MAG: preprotein translocase subunit SecG [Clostridia bacterium]|nr:preprotein translocase subunit SecG [Clostridia bacterium]